jgi:hypothetical protein
MIFGTDAVSTPDSVSLPTTTDNWFTQGNGTSILGTQVPAYWVNKVGGEIDYAIESSGQTLSMTNRGQLWAALNGFVTQGGGTGQLTTKINLGQDSTTGLLRAAIGGTDYGLIPSLDGPAGSSTFQNGIIADGVDAGGGQMRIVNGSYGAFWQHNGTALQLLVTASGTPYGSYNSLRPMYVSLTTGALDFDGTGAGSTFGGNVTVSGSSLTATGNNNNIAIARGSQSFQTAGSVSFTVPSNVYFIKETDTGGGGGGAYCNASGGNYISGGGGGAGGTVIVYLSVSPGQVITGTVGAAGLPGGSGTGTSGAAGGTAGGTTTFGSYSATGGSGAVYGTATSSSGGIGGSSSGGGISTVIQGGDGTDGMAGTLIFSGSGGASYWGGGGRSGSLGGGGQPGQAPGSGGGGVYDGLNSATIGNAGAGKAGQIMVEW